MNLLDGEIGMTNPFSCDSPVNINNSETKVLIVYVGGTIGMRPVGPSGVYVPSKGYLREKIRKISLFVEREEGGWFISPPTKDKVHSKFKILEYENLLDSSMMDFRNWNQIGRTIAENYDDYDSFIVLHGTDTMSYTSSALSFMFENLQKTVILTGSQIPLSETRNDAFDNLLGALFVATQYPLLPEVFLFFHHCLYRGSRVTKFSSSGLLAFATHNTRRIMKLGISVDLDWSQIRHRPNRHSRFHFVPIKCGDVEVVHMYPGMKPSILATALLEGQTRAAVILTFGSGNINIENQSYLDILSKAQERGIVVVNISQCPKGSVQKAMYETALPLDERGVVPGFDMTLEAAYTKLMHLLSKEDLQIEKERRIQILKENVMKNLRGELTPPVSSKRFYSLGCLDFVHAVAEVIDRRIDLNSPNGSRTCERSVIENVKSVLFPTIINSLVALGDEERLNEMLQGYRGDVSLLMDSNRKTPLHVAASHGNLEIAKLLVESYDSKINVEDINGKTPVQFAMLKGNSELVRYLKSKGAVVESGEKLMELYL